MEKISLKNINLKIPGIINPIEAERYSQGVGLGASGSKIVHGVEATHQEKTKAALYSRYNQL